MPVTTLKSISKINIGLRVLNRREDGFHNIETIFYPLKLHDDISFEIENSITGYNSVVMKSNRSYIPLTKDNLCYKAIENFFKYFKIKDCYKITLNLKKFIPVGGGLGGGSSNAASIIRFLVKYFQIDINANRKKILDIALTIGSDVPFFMIMKPCYAEGRGEIMTMLPAFIVDYDILVVNPNLHVSTKWAFEKFRQAEFAPKEPLLKNIKIFSHSDTNLYVNDFEEIVFKKFDELGVIKEELMSSGAVYASMSGTGATMFGFFNKDNSTPILKCRDHYNSKKYYTYISD